MRTFRTPGWRSHLGPWFAMAAIGIAIIAAAARSVGSGSAAVEFGTAGSWRELDSADAPANAYLAGDAGSATLAYPGVDGRTAVPLDAPYRNSLVYLEIEYAGGGLAACSGTIVGQRTVLTAAHCLVDNGSDKLSRVRVVVGLDGASALASQYASSSVVPEAWRAPIVFPNRPPAEFDYGLVFLPDTSLTQQAGIFPGKLSALRDVDLAADTRLTTAGYPGDCQANGCPRKQVAGDRNQGHYAWASTSGFFSLQRDFVQADFDTFGGASGSAIWRPSDMAIVAVLDTEGFFFVRGARVTERMIATLQEWCGSVSGCSLNVASQPPRRSILPGLALDSEPLIAAPSTDGCSIDRAYLRSLAVATGAWQDRVTALSVKTATAILAHDTAVLRRLPEELPAVQTAADAIVAIEPPEHFKSYDADAEKGVQLFEDGLSVLITAANSGNTTDILAGNAKLKGAQDAFATMNAEYPEIPAICS